MSEEKKTRGGKREGAGRPATGIETITISFRVRKQWVPKIKAAVKKEIKKLKLP